MAYRLCISVPNYKTEMLVTISWGMGEAGATRSFNRRLLPGADPPHALSRLRTRRQRPRRSASEQA